LLCMLMHTKGIFLLEGSHMRDLSS
jgi:hypothetical protein